MGERKMVKDKKTYLIAALVLLLILALGYICINKYNEGQQTKLNAVYQQGMQAGTQQAQQLIMNQILSDLNSYGATAVVVPVSQNQSITIPLIAQTTIIQSLNKNGVFEFNTIDQKNETVKIQLIMPQMCEQIKQQATTTQTTS
jgi:hypothetical protein